MVYSLYVEIKMGNFYFFVLTSSDVLVYDKITFTFKCCNWHGPIVHDKRYHVKCAMTNFNRVEVLSLIVSPLRLCKHTLVTPTTRKTYLRTASVANYL